MNRLNHWLLLFIPVIFYSACNHHPGNSFTEKSYILKREQTIRIPELDLQISNKGCGRQWTDQSETPFCEPMEQGRRQYPTRGMPCHGS